MADRSLWGPLIAAAPVVLAGCALFPPTKVEVDVADIEAAFPAIERLSAVVYMRQQSGGSEPDCEYLEYSRGAFSSTPEDEFCRVFVTHDRPAESGLDGPTPVAFDDQAKADLAALHEAFEGVGASLEYMNLGLANGSVTAGSNFSFDNCLVYSYQPGWTTLPDAIEGEAFSTPIDQDWYQTDNCP